MNLKHLRKRGIETFGKKNLVPVLILVFNLNSYSQEYDPPRSLKLIFEPVQEVTDDQVGNIETEGILGSPPAGIDLKVKAEIELPDTAGLSKIYISLGTSDTVDNLLISYIDFPDAVKLNDTSLFYINENIVVIYLGAFPKPPFMSCSVYLENKEGLTSEKIKYQTR